MPLLQYPQSMSNRLLQGLVYRLHFLAILLVLFGSVCPAAIAQNQLKPNANQPDLSPEQTTPVPESVGISPTSPKSNDSLLIEKEKLKLEQERVKL